MKKSNISAIFGNNKDYIDCGKTLPLILESPPLRSLKTKTRTIMTALLYTFVYFLSLYVPIPTSGQVIHQSFEIGERKAITLKLDIPYTVETWAGNTILTETKVKMDNIPPNILQHFIDKGRYEIVEATTETTIELKMKDTDLRPIRTKKGDADESINCKIFVPEDCIVTRLGKGNVIAAEQTGQ